MRGSAADHDAVIMIRARPEAKPASTFAGRALRSRGKNKKPGGLMIYVVATLTIRPEMRAQLIAGAKTCIDITRKENGCIRYDLNESTTDPSRFVFVEQWDSMEDLMAHGTNEHMKPWRKIVKECMSAPTKIEIITPEKVDIL
jgi:quinol monooxygenase YgiN